MSNQIEILKKKIGTRLKTYRKAAGLTQDELAEKLQRSPEGISNIERGSSLPPLDTLCIFADALGISVFDFFKGKQDSQTSKREEAEAAIHSHLEQFSDDEMSTALRIISALRTHPE